MLKTFMLFVILTLGMCSSIFAQKEITGTITASNAKSFTIKCDKCDELPSMKDTCQVSKDISGTKNPFGITIQSGWMSVADALLLNRKGNVLSFIIIRETTNIVVNGKKQEQFLKGKKMKVIWK